MQLIYILNLLDILNSLLKGKKKCFCMKINIKTPEQFKNMNVFPTKMKTSAQNNLHAVNMKGKH